MARPKSQPYVTVAEAVERAKQRAAVVSGLSKGSHQEEWERCRADFAYWCSTYAETYDPRRTPSHVPFKLWDFQKDVAEKLQRCEGERRSVVVVKSRDMGMSWLLAAYAVWCWLTKPPGDKTTLSSYKENRVDELGNPDSLMEKCRMIVRRLPVWQLPTGFEESSCMKRLNFVNPENGNSVTGEFGKNTGRAGRCSRLLLDEYAHYEELDAVDASVSAASEFRVYLSTPLGANKFADKFYSGLYENILLNWDLHPDRDEKWLEEKAKDMEPHMLAQEYMCDFTASVAGVVIPGTWVRAAVGFVHPSDPEAAGEPVVVGLDVGASSAKTTVATVRRGYRVLEVVATDGRDTTLTAQRVKSLCEGRRAVQLNFDASGIGASIGSALTHMGCKFNVIPVLGGQPPKRRWWGDGKKSSERFLNRRAEDWYMVRQRFEKTYETVNGIKEHPADECISVPNLPSLIAQLSMPTMVQTGAGKSKVESKEEMRRRGVMSPDIADSLVYAFCEDAVGKEAFKPVNWFSGKNSGAGFARVR